MMFRINILIGLSILSCCVALDDSRNARILNQYFDNTGAGLYKYSFETSDGTSKDEQGEVHYPNTADEFVKVTGSYKYTGPDGHVYFVKYTADDQGFHPEGDHIKVPPFVPWVHHGHKPNYDDESQESKTPSVTHIPSKHSDQNQPEAHDTFGKVPYQYSTYDYGSSITTPKAPQQYQSESYESNEKVPYPYSRNDYDNSITTPKQYQPYNYNVPSSTPTNRFQEKTHTNPSSPEEYDSKSYRYQTGDYKNSPNLVQHYQSLATTENTPSDNYSTPKSTGEYGPVNFPAEENHISQLEPTKTPYQQDTLNDLRSKPAYKLLPSGFTPFTPNPNLPSRYIDLPKSDHGTSYENKHSTSRPLTLEGSDDFPKSPSEQPDQYLDLSKNTHEDAHFLSGVDQKSPSVYHPDSSPYHPNQYKPDTFSSTTSSPDLGSARLTQTPVPYKTSIASDKLYIPPSSSTIAPYKLNGLDSS